MKPAELRGLSRVVTTALAAPVEFAIEDTGGNCKALVASYEDLAIVLHNGDAGLPWTNDGDCWASIFTMAAWHETGDTALVEEEAPVGAFLGQWIAGLVEKAQANRG